jgi:hypothetical protein
MNFVMVMIDIGNLRYGIRGNFWGYGDSWTPFLIWRVVRAVYFLVSSIIFGFTTNVKYWLIFLILFESLEVIKGGSD